MVLNKSNKWRKFCLLFSRCRQPKCVPTL